MSLIDYPCSSTCLDSQVHFADNNHKQAGFEPNTYIQTLHATSLAAQSVSASNFLCLVAAYAGYMMQPQHFKALNPAGSNPAAVEPAKETQCCLQTVSQLHVAPTAKAAHSTSSMLGAMFSRSGHLHCAAHSCNWESETLGP